MLRFLCSLFISLLLGSMSVFAQEKLPEENTMIKYHNAPNYRESESHPLRIVAYIFHPIGWALREGIFRPWSYFVSSNDARSEIFGYRKPYDFRKPSCYGVDDFDCKKLPPYDYASRVGSNKAKERLEKGLEQEVFLSDVNFDFDQRKLNDTGRKNVAEIAQLIKEQPGVTIVLEGHTDYLGSESYNEKLGMDRAEAVRSELVKLSISEDKLSAVTFGETRPKAEGKDDASRAINRRVEVKFDNSKLTEAAE